MKWPYSRFLPWKFLIENKTALFIGETKVLQFRSDVERFSVVQIAVLFDIFWDLNGEGLMPQRELESNENSL